jgi:hypothetical protein
LLNIGDEAQLVNLRSDLDDAASAFASARSEFEPFGDPEYRADYIENYGVNEFNRAMGEAQERVEATGAAVKAIQESMKAVEASKIDYVLDPIVVGTPGSGTSTDDKDKPKKGGGKSPAQQAKDDFDALIASLDGAEKANQDFAKAQDVVNNALKNGIITQEQADMTLAVLTDRMKVARGEMLDLSSVAGVLEDGFTNAFMSILDGTESTKDAFRSMAKAVIAELYRVLVVQRLVGSIGGGGIVGAIGNIFPALTNSASGGALMAGQASVVGEHGRELFVPSTSGRVLSVPQAKAAMGGGGGVVVNQTINVTTGVQQTVRAEIKQLMPQIADSAKAAVLDAKRRGGAYGSAF